LLKALIWCAKMGMAAEKEETLLYILWGEDQFSLEEALQNIKKSMGDMTLLSTNTNILEGQKLTLNELKSVGEAVPFLSDKRLIIIKGLLERFEPKDKSSRAKKSNSSANRQDEWQSLADCIRGLPKSTILVLIDAHEAKKTAFQNNLLFKAISSQAEVRNFPTIKGIKLSQWIQARVDKQNGSISRQGISVLAEVIGGDLHIMANEINKLIAFTAGRMIEEKDIRMVVSAAQEANIFAMVDAIMDRKAGLAEQILQKLLQNGIMPSQILVLLARQIQVLIQVKELKRLKRPPPEIQGKLGITYGFIWDKISRRAERYTIERLKNIYQNLLETDVAIKTGRFDGDLALNLLVADLCDRPSS
jgi:DNA polymerase-3 subunit delta